MFRQIFVNLPIKDMARSQAFFKALGLTFNQRFTNEQGACLEIGENFYAMLLVEPFFQGFTKKPVSDAHKATEVLIALSVDSRAEAEEVVRKADG
ncbi:MAG: extradiol dioxygenase, partial [Burkholderiales bacterium RIFCSPHIGHO2_02_FULL_66_10]